MDGMCGRQWWKKKGPTLIKGHSRVRSLLEMMPPSNSQLPDPISSKDRAKARLRTTVPINADDRANSPKARRHKAKGDRSADDRDQSNGNQRRKRDGLKHRGPWFVRQA